MKMDPFGTHQALLTAAMVVTEGDILEMGGGWYSTPLVNSFAALQGRGAWTIETGDFVYNILKRYQSDRHQVKLLGGFRFDQIGKFTGDPGKTKQHYIDLQGAFLQLFWKERSSCRLSVAFIDQAPGFLRVPAI